MPASLDGVILHSHGHRMLGSFFRPVANGPSKIPGVERRGCPTVLLLHGIPGVEKNYDLAYALRGAGWNVLGGAKATTLCPALWTTSPPRWTI
ncbi:MAG: hypothetical protein HW378_4926 [Anaerolineales bacterium]|nr:hypothetical protein [Anaerolineales bacterium]